MSMSTQRQCQVRPGQMWAEQNPRLGLRVFIIKAVQDDCVLMRTVYDEGIIGVGDTTVPLTALHTQHARWQFVSESNRSAQ